MTTFIYALTNKGHVDDVVKSGSVKNILMSYWFLKKNPLKLLEYINGFNVDIFMLDSGAFSAWKNNKVIVLWDYIDFIKNYHQYFTHIVCLDVINEPVFSEVNHLIMLDELKDLNLTIIPVFHSGESFKVLDYMIKKGYKYIGISPNNNWPEMSKREWLNRVYQYCDFEKLGIRTHGFGYQSVKGLKSFPMTTADSSTWTVGKKYGEIIDETGRIRYSDWVKDDDKHIDNIPGGDSGFVKSICEKMGLEPSELRDNWRARDKFNIEAIRALSEIDNGEISIQSDFLLDIDFCNDFSENKVNELYEEIKSMGRLYSGNSTIISNNPSIKKIKVSQMENIF